MYRIPFFVLLVLVMACNNSTGPVEETTELEGTWIGYEVDGDEGEWVFNASGYDIDISFIGTDNTTLITTLEFELNANDFPKEIDMTILTYISNGVPFTVYENEVSFGIYKIEDADLLTFAANEPGSSIRPTEFTSEGDQRLFVASKQ